MTATECASVGGESEQSSLHPLLAFEVSSYDNDQDAMIALNGDLDGFTATRLRDALGHALRNHPSRLYLDLTDVTFVDSSGLGALAGAYREAQHQGCRLVLCSPARSVRKVLELTGFSELFTIQSDRR
ncbi:MAG: STAS domain-containing protein [Acidimicrobiales bacterium]